MNIYSLQELLTRTEEIFVIDKTSEIKGIICNVIGVVRNSRQLQLLVLQYDEVYQERREAEEALQLVDTPQRPQSNRELQRSKEHNDFINPFQSVDRFFIGGKAYEVAACQSRWLNLQDWESIWLLSDFLRNGWQAKGINYQRIDTLMLTTLELQGEYLSIPAFSEDAALRFVMRPDTVTYPVEKPITLRIGGVYPDKLRFRNMITGEAHWAQINRVYLMNVWAELEKIFNDPRVQEQITSEELAQHKSNFEKEFLELCPKGMYFTVVEYECQGDISLQFYTKAYLDAKPVTRGKSMGFIVRPEKPKGILGSKLKIAVIQEPVTENTETLEVELFQYFQTTIGEDIII